MLMTTFVIIKKTEVDEFYTHIYDIEASIKLTVEHQTNNSIPFLMSVLLEKSVVG